MCITNIRQRNLSTNKGYRATFTKAQVGKDLGTEAGQYGSFYRFPYTHNALTAKNALVWSVHTPGGGTGAHRRGVANGVGILFPFRGLSEPFVLQPALTALAEQAAAGVSRARGEQS